MKTLLVLVVITLVPHASAQIGMSQKEAISRFGEPTSSGKHSTLALKKVVVLGPWLGFLSGRWSIRCDFVEDRCVRTAYGDRGRQDSWREEDIQRVLAANVQGKKWEEHPPENTKLHRRAWKRTDGATATFGEFTGLSIATPDYQRARLAAGAELTSEGWAGLGPVPDEKKPNKAPEPTPGTVTPRATDPKSR